MNVRPRRTPLSSTASSVCSTTYILASSSRPRVELDLLRSVGWTRSGTSTAINERWTSLTSSRCSSSLTCADSGWWLGLAVSRKGAYVARWLSTRQILIESLGTGISCRSMRQERPHSLLRYGTVSEAGCCFCTAATAATRHPSIHERRRKSSQRGLFSPIPQPWCLLELEGASYEAKDVGRVPSSYAVDEV